MWFSGMMWGDARILLMRSESCQWRRPGGKSSGSEKIETVRWILSAVASIQQLSSKKGGTKFGGRGDSGGFASVALS